MRSLLSLLSLLSLQSFRVGVYDGLVRANWKDCREEDMSDHSELQGKTVLITGASNGIGAATAERFAKAGAFSLLHYNSHQDSAEEVMANVRSLGGDGRLLKADLSVREGCREFVEQIKGIERPIDILINNAGSLIRRVKVREFPWELWDQVLELNLSSAFFLSQAVLPGMVDRGEGIIVNVSSIAARNGGGIGALAYASAKGALNTMTRALAKEFAPLGIRVNAVSPGTIDTNYHRNFSNPEMLKSVAEATPVKRIGQPDEIAGVILFLCSSAASFMQGEIVEVNGGFFMG